MPKFVYMHVWGFQWQNILLFSEYKCAFDSWRYHMLLFLIVWVFFRAVLRSQKTWEEGTEISHISPAATHAEPLHDQHPSSGDTFITNDEPTLMHLYRSESIVYITIPSRCCTFCGYGRIHNDRYPSLWYHTQYFHCPKNHLSALPIHSSVAPTPGNHWSFTLSTVLPFPECHIIGIIQYVAFSDWLRSFSNMHLRFLQVFSWLNSSFLFSAE